MSNVKGCENCCGVICGIYRYYILKREKHRKSSQNNRKSDETMNPGPT